MLMNIVVKFYIIFVKIICLKIFDINIYLLYNYIFFVS